MPAKVRGRAVVVAGMLSVFLAACGGGGGAGSNTRLPEETQNPNAVAGGTLNLGVWAEPASFLDAGIVDNLTFSSIIDAPVQEGLLWYRSSTQTQNAHTLADYWAPDLATEVPTLANGDVRTAGCTTAGAKMCVTWKLRQGVRWDDGSNFTSHDVCDTFRFWYLKWHNNNPTALVTTSGWDQVVGCTETDKFTAVVDFGSTYAEYLGLGSGVYGILPASILDKVLSHNLDLRTTANTFDLTAGTDNPQAFKGSATLDMALDGTGPYVFQKYDRGQEIVLVRNNNYWNKAHMPHIDKLVFKMESDLTSEVNAAKAGDVDMAFDLRLFNLDGLLSASNSGGKFKVQTIGDSGAEKIDFNLCANDGTLCDNAAVKKNPFTADIRVRRAIFEGVNRRAIVNNQAAGMASIPKDSFLYLGAQWIDDPSIPQTKYDPAKANSDLDAAGYKRDASCGLAPNGQAFRKGPQGCVVINIGTTSNNASREAVEALVQSDLANIGIDVPSPFTPNQLPDQFFGTFSDGGPLYTHAFDMAMYTTILGKPAEPDTLYPDYHGDCGGTCTADKGKNNIPSSANGGNGQNDTGINDPIIDLNLDKAHTSIDLTARRKAYIAVEQQLAKDLPELPLYQQVTVDTYSTNLQGLRDNDIVWDFNTYDWWCVAGNCQA